MAFPAEMLITVMCDNDDDVYDQIRVQAHRQKCSTTPLCICSIKLSHVMFNNSHCFANGFFDVLCTHLPLSEFHSSSTHQ